MKSWHEPMPMGMDLESTPSASRIFPPGAGNTLADFQTATGEEPGVVHRPGTTVPASTALMHAQSDAPVFPRLGALANEGRWSPDRPPPRRRPTRVRDRSRQKSRLRAPIRKRRSSASGGGARRTQAEPFKVPRPRPAAGRANSLASRRTGRASDLGTSHSRSSRLTSAVGRHHAPARLAARQSDCAKSRGRRKMRKEHDSWLAGGRAVARQRSCA
jgi:hypothetical protein